MLLTKYGEFDFHYGGVKYFGKPSFGCIAGVGTPKEIIDTVKVICSPVRYHDTYRESFNLLQLCVDKPLPKEFEPKLFMGKNGKTIPNHIDEVNKLFVINMAKHCIVHAMNGKPKDTVESIGKAEVITEFDPYEWIESAIELLGMTTEQAANLSMTEHIARVESKPWYKEARKKDKEKGMVSPAESIKLMNEQREMDKKLRERLKAAN
tara:strand:+ start:688 stop:1311 length:624 start_codon:yes stop_codon:yes gene_type:complete